MTVAVYLCSVAEELLKEFNRERVKPDLPLAMAGIKVRDNANEYNYIPIVMM